MSSWHFTFFLLSILTIQLTFSNENYSAQSDAEIEVMFDDGSEELDIAPMKKIKKIKKKIKKIPKIIKKVKPAIMIVGPTPKPARIVPQRRQPVRPSSIKKHSSAQQLPPIGDKINAHKVTDKNSQSRTGKDKSWWGFVKKQYKRAKHYSKDLWQRYTKR